MVYAQTRNFQEYATHEIIWDFEIKMDLIIQIVLMVLCKENFRYNV